MRHTRMVENLLEWNHIKVNFVWVFASIFISLDRKCIAHEIRRKLRFWNGELLIAVAAVVLLFEQWIWNRVRKNVFCVKEREKERKQWIFIVKRCTWILLMQWECVLALRYFIYAKHNKFYRTANFQERRERRKKNKAKKRMKFMCLKRANKYSLVSISHRVNLFICVCVRPYGNLNHFLFSFQFSYESSAMWLHGQMLANFPFATKSRAKNIAIL